MKKNYFFGAAALCGLLAFTLSCPRKTLQIYYFVLS